MLPANVLLDDAVSAWAESHRCGDEIWRKRDKRAGMGVGWGGMGGFVDVDVDVDVLCCWLCLGRSVESQHDQPTDKAEKRNDQEDTL